MVNNLPSEKQKVQLADMIHYAFIEIRLIVAQGCGEQAADLADAFHNVSIEMFGRGVWNPKEFRSRLEDYQNKYKKGNCDSIFNYLSRFDAIFPEIS